MKFESLRGKEVKSGNSQIGESELPVTDCVPDIVLEIAMQYILSYQKAGLAEIIPDFHICGPDPDTGEIRLWCVENPFYEEDS